VTDRLRAVLDTNVFLSAFLSRSRQARPAYDHHFDSLGSHGDVKITKALLFLWALRGDVPPEDPSS
jgi:hypothetical protein